MRILVFEHDANPLIDSAIYKLSRNRAIEMVREGKAEIIDDRRIRKIPPEGEDVSMRKWVSRQVSVTPEGVLRIATLQMVTMGRSGCGLLLHDTSQ